MALDLLLASLPPSYLEDPVIAPALLKAAVESNGFTCLTIDFSLDILKKVFNNDYHNFLEWNKILTDHHEFRKATPHQLELLDSSTDVFVNLIIKHAPRYVGLSVFSTWQQRYAYFLCKKIKEKNIHTKIIIGGMGCNVPPTALVGIEHLDYFDQKNNYANFILKKKLSDYAVLNDGETELVNILAKNQLAPSVSHEVPFNYEFYPNYDNYALEDYFYFNNEKKLLVQGSKGCVRKCVFCSEHDNYTKFYFKSGEAIAQELIALSKKYKIYKFQFTDSLVNGSLSEFKKFFQTLAEYNQLNQPNQIKWHGNYICRSKNSMSDADYKMLKLSGAHGLTIGAESGSNRVLTEMKKQSTAEDLIYEISKFEEFDIDCTLLFLIGFYNETWDDFLLTLKLLKKLQKYFFTGTISAIRCGYTLSISNWKHIDSTKFKYINNYNWIYLENPSLTLTERIRRRIIIQEFCDSLNILISYSREDLIILDSLYTNNLDHVKELDYGHN
jgi:radical SAM superfamily enzyme YgiQ (UPF0313 family)